jgi:hypothetical protein
MSDPEPFDETRLAALLAALPPAPEAWVRAAEILPLAVLDADALVERCRADSALRERVLEGLESALRSTHEPTRDGAATLRERLRGD